MRKTKNIETESIVMAESLKAMQSLGKSVTRNEIRREIRDHSDVISEDEVDQIRKSKKGNEYHPFEFRSNFAIKHLITAGFINDDGSNHVSLTEKGRNVDFTQFDPYKDVWPLVEELDKLKQEPKSDDSQQDYLSDDSEDSWRLELKAALKKMSPRKFEMFCRGLLKNMNIDVDDTLGISYVGDGGIDGYGYYESEFDFRTERVALQAKRWENKISAPDIDKFRGAMDKYNADYGLFITTSDFTREAINAARAGSHVITLINGDRICDLVAKYNYYVEPVTTYRLKDFYTDDK